MESLHHLAHLRSAEPITPQTPTSLASCTCESTVTVSPIFYPPTPTNQDHPRLSTKKRPQTRTRAARFCSVAHPYQAHCPVVLHPSRMETNRMLPRVRTGDLVASAHYVCQSNNLVHPPGK